MKWKRRVVSGGTFLVIGFLIGSFYGGFTVGYLSTIMPFMAGFGLGDITGVLGLIKGIIQRRREPRLGFGVTQNNNYDTHFLRVSRISGEGSARRCSARIVSPELDVDNDTVWNIKPYPREFDVQDEYIPLFTMRKNPQQSGYTQIGTFLTFYIANKDTGYEERVITLKGDVSLENHLEVVLNVGEGKPPKESYRKTISEILRESTHSNSLGDLGNPY